MKLIKNAFTTWKNQGFGYLLNQIPNYLKWRVSGLFSLITLDRKEALSICENNEDYRIWNYTSSANLQLDPPSNNQESNPLSDLSGTYHCNPNFVSVFSNVQLIGPYAIPQVSDGQILLEPLGTEAVLGSNVRETFDKIGFLRTIKLTLRKFLNTNSKYKIDEAVHLVARHGPNYDHPNYGHWINENLPQLQAIKYYIEETGNNPILLINPDPPSWLIDLLKLMGFAEEDWMEWKYIYAEVDKLIVPKLNYIHSFEAHPNPIGKKWARKTILENKDTVDKSTYPSRIFMSRQGSQRRKIENFEEVKEILNQYGFEFYRPENLTTEEEINVFSQADVILGVAGSNIAGIIYSSNATLIEILPYDQYMPVYYTLANELDLEYMYIMGEDVTKESENDQHKNIVVDIDELKQNLQNIEKK